MGIRTTLSIILLLLNAVPLYAVYRAIQAGVPPKSRRWALLSVSLVVLALNVPLGVLWVRSLSDYLLYNVSASTLRAIFQPSLAWYTTALLCTLILVPAYIIRAAGVAAGRLVLRSRPGLPRPNTVAEGVSRRSFFTTSAGLLVPALYGASAYKFGESFDEVEISPELAIPMAHLPRSLEGVTIVHLTDLHVGTYIRREEVAYWVSLVNGLRPDLVVLTGDLIDRSLEALPDLLAGLKGLRPSLGVVAVLGNHDLTSDRYSSRGEFVGGETIAQGLRDLGIRTLRNEVAYLRRGEDRLAILGLDWMSRPGERNFYRYKPVETRRQLARLSAQLPPETPSILLVHHPDTFSEVPRFGIGLTLAGHTHGGGQVVFYHRDGHAVGLFSSRFRYVSGLYREHGCSLYVNRGLGYLAVPVRVNCAPEISRFRLVRA
ncbi:MAG: metallophosphoesterase [Bryobacterales bacterium]|nr:metallophosphoesterase [Bryobacteraceae bacterium]MDW8352982.1 metallophosphoesterase [Bryobacterales bacterium]